MCAKTLNALRLAEGSLWDALHYVLIPNAPEQNYYSGFGAELSWIQRLHVHLIQFYLNRRRWQSFSSTCNQNIHYSELEICIAFPHIFILFADALEYLLHMNYDPFTCVISSTEFSPCAVFICAVVYMFFIIRPWWFCVPSKTAS